MCNVACTRRAEGTGRVRNCARCGGDVTSTAACERILLHEIMATPPAAQAGQDGSLDMATRVPLGTTGIVVTQSVKAAVSGAYSALAGTERVVF